MAAAMPDDALLRGLIEVLDLSLSTPRPPSAAVVRGVAQALAAHLASDAADAQGRRTVRGGLPGYKLQRIVAAMHANLGERFALAPYARMAGLSVFHFSRAFKQATGLAPSRYAARLGVDEARRLLCATGDAVIDVGMALGYRSPSHFSQVFRQLTGMTPSAYRRHGVRQPSTG